MYWKRPSFYSLDDLQVDHMTEDVCKVIPPWLRWLKYAYLAAGEKVLSRRRTMPVKVKGKKKQ